jgi:signal transduction histidine kinase
MKKISFFICLLVCQVFVQKNFAQTRTDSLLQVLKTLSPTAPAYLPTLTQLAYEYHRNQPDTAQQLAKKVLALAEEQKKPFFEAQAHKILGLAAQVKDNLTTAADELNQALKVFQERKETAEIVECYNGLGRVYFAQNEGEKALQIFLQALQLSEPLNKPLLRAATLDNMGIMYNAQRNYIACLDYFFQALALREKARDQPGLATSYSNIGSVYTEKKDFNRANAYYNQALLICEETNDTYNMLRNVSKLGENYYRQGDFEKAMTYFEKAAALSKVTGDKTLRAASLANMGDIYLQQKQTDKAFSFHRQALAMAEQPEVLRQVYQGLYRDYRRTGNTAEALNYFEKYISLRDSLFSLQTSEKISLLQNQYELNKRENEINKLKAQNAKESEEATQSAWQRNALLIGLLSLAALTVVLVRNARQRQEINKQLEARNEEISRQKEELALQKEDISHKNEELTTLNATKDRFFSIIAHDLRSPIASFAAFAELMVNYYDGMTTEEVKSMAVDLNKSVKNLGQLTDNLLLWGRLQMRQTEPVFKNVSVLAVAQETVAQLKPLADSKQVFIQVEPYEATVHADENYLRFIIRNLVTNAIKFTHPGGGIIIGSSKKKGMIQIYIADTGVGMSDEAMQHLFDTDSKTSVKGTAGEKGTGLGLVLCKEFVEKLGGQIWVESQEEKGSIFTFSLKAGLPETYQELLDFMKKKPSVN